MVAATPVRLGTRAGVSRSAYGVWRTAFDVRRLAGLQDR
jgi:hypothetical protein